MLNRTTINYLRSLLKIFLRVYFIVFVLNIKETLHESNKKNNTIQFYWRFDTKRDSILEKECGVSQLAKILTFLHDWWRTSN